MYLLQVNIEQEHVNNMKTTANLILYAATTYLSLPSKPLLGKAQTSQEQASRLETEVRQFLKDCDDAAKNIRLTYYAFVKNTITTIATIPQQDKLHHYLERAALTQLHDNLDKVMQYQSSNTSQEYLGIYILLLKDKLHITDEEENTLSTSRTEKLRSNFP